MKIICHYIEDHIPLERELNDETIDIKSEPDMEEMKGIHP
jgi:hypothetical protein